MEEEREETDLIAKIGDLETTCKALTEASDALMDCEMQLQRKHTGENLQMKTQILYHDFRQDKCSNFPALMVHLGHST